MSIKEMDLYKNEKVFFKLTSSYLTKPKWISFDVYLTSKGPVTLPTIVV